MAGFIYIMSNPAFPNLIKIGKSKTDPTNDTLSTLNQTGIPEPFKVEYYAFVEDEDFFEKEIHSYFNLHRTNKNRDFFAVGCAEAIDVIRHDVGEKTVIKYEELFYRSEAEIEVEKLKRQQEKWDVMVAQSEKEETERGKEEKKEIEELRWLISTEINKKFGRLEVSMYIVTFQILWSVGFWMILVGSTVSEFSEFIPLITICSLISFIYCYFNYKITYDDKEIDDLEVFDLKVLWANYEHQKKELFWNSGTQAILWFWFIMICIAFFIGLFDEESTSLTSAWASFIAIGYYAILLIPYPILLRLGFNIKDLKEPKHHTKI